MIKPIITGSFMDFVHVNNWDAHYWVDNCLKWEEKNWRALMTDMHEIGMDTVINTNMGFWGRPLYPANTKTVGLKWDLLKCNDPLEVCMNQCDQLGMKFFIGAGFYGRISMASNPEFLSGQGENINNWYINMAEDLVEKYSHHKSFAGIYQANEINIVQNEGSLLESTFSPAAEFAHKLRKRVGKNIKMLLSTNNPRGTTSIGLKKLNSQLSEIDVDIIAYMDTFARSGSLEKASAAKDFFTKSMPIHHKNNKEAWSNIEIWRKPEKRPDGRCQGCPPCEFEDAQLQIEAGITADKIITYQYQGIMNKKTELVNIGAEKSHEFYEKYLKYINRIK